MDGPLHPPQRQAHNACMPDYLPTCTLQLLGPVLLVRRDHPVLESAPVFGGFEVPNPYGNAFTGETHLVKTNLE